MNHSYMIKTIQEKMESFDNVIFESIESIKPFDGLILSKYVGITPDYKFLGKDGKRNNGFLRCYVWAKNPTKNYKLLDELSDFLIGDFKKICIKEDMIIQGPALNEGLFMSLISFKIEALDI